MWSKGKTLINIFLITAALNTVTLNQFSKLPLFVIHYVHHWHNNNDISLLDFIQMHYFGNDQRDNDNEQDKQLPLKSVAIDAFQTFTAPTIFDILYRSRIAFISTPSASMKDQFIPTGIVADIFRPPKA
jgi:hypothetical protein